MANSVSEYLEAVKEHEAAKAKASELVQFISNVADALRYDLRSFCALTYSINIDHSHSSRPDPRRRADMARWPTSEEIKQALSDWNEADTRRRRAWGGVPKADQVGLTPPPSAVSL